MGHLATGRGRASSGRTGRMGLFKASRAGNLRGAESPGGGPVTLVELKVVRYELEDREKTLLEHEKRAAAGNQWAQRRDLREQRHHVELRRAEIERRIRAMEGAA